MTVRLGRSAADLPAADRLPRRAAEWTAFVAARVLWKYPLTADRHWEIRDRLAEMDRERARLNTPGHRPLEDGLV